ncbi:MAG: hypothetical protein JWN02_554, partial [Acidobacteria bacterium]|nr:hypothetical protein [Acidobacteriota bacterium]
MESRRMIDIGGARDGGGRAVLVATRLRNVVLRERVSCDVRPTRRIAAIFFPFLLAAITTSAFAQAATP